MIACVAVVGWLVSVGSIYTMLHLVCKASQAVERSSNWIATSDLCSTRCTLLDHVIKESRLADTIRRTLYQEVADDLRSQIASGTLQKDSQIPSTPALAEHYGVSSTVVRNAVALLREEGLVEGIQGKGVFVVATPTEIKKQRQSVQTVHDEVTVLRQEVQSLGRQVGDSPPSDVVAKIEELRTEVGQLEAHLRLLYDRLGQPYPHGQSTPEQKRRTGA